MKLTILVIRLFLIASEGAAQKPKRKSHYSLADVEKFRRKLSKFTDDTKYLTNLEQNYIENVRRELRKHPLLSVINEKLDEVKHKFNEAGTCKNLIDSKLKDFGVTLKESIVLTLSQAKTIVVDDMANINNQLHSMDPDLTSQKGIIRVQDKIDSIFRSFEEVSRKYSTQRANIRHILGQTLSEDITALFKKLVLTPVVNCVTDNLPFEWLMEHFFKLLKPTLM